MEGRFIIINSKLNKILMLFLIVIFLGSCGNEKPVSDNGEMLVKEAMQEQMESWNRGDIPAFMEYYWNNDSLQFVSKNGISKGWNKVLSNYLKAYPTQEKMGDLLFELKRVNQVSIDCVFVVGSWNLTYQNQPDVGGYFTLMWKLKPEGWRIVLDHTS